MPKPPAMSIAFKKMSWVDQGDQQRRAKGEGPAQKRVDPAQVVADQVVHEPDEPHTVAQIGGGNGSHGKTSGQQEEG